MSYDSEGIPIGAAEAEARWSKWHEQFPWLDHLSNGEPLHRSASDLYEMISKFAETVFQDGIREGETRVADALADKSDAIRSILDRIEEKLEPSNG
jgi:hypothetical protein